MAKCVPIIQVNVSNKRPESDERIKAWRSFAQQIVDDGTERVVILNADTRMVVYRQAWLEFADQFIFYLNEQFPLPYRPGLDRN